MVKLYRQPIEVQINPDGQPVAFRWRKLWYYIANCATAEEKTWWRKLPRFAEPERFRCETREGMVCDLVKDKVGWILERVWD